MINLLMSPFELSVVVSAFHFVVLSGIGDGGTVVGNVTVEEKIIKVGS